MKMKLVKLLVLLVVISACSSKYSRSKSSSIRKTNHTKTVITTSNRKEISTNQTTSYSTYKSDTSEETLEATSAVKVTPAVIRQYIEDYKDIAMVEMQRYNIPASITLAQGILESGSGQGRLARLARNHFGIKCHLGWEGEIIHHDDDEKGECFRKYIRAEDSFEDHSLFLVNRPRYASLFQLKPSDYKGWAYGLKKAGYATDPKYPTKLIFLIDKYELHKYDKQVLGEVYHSLKNHSEPIQLGEQTIYIVQAGDTLYSISRKTGVSVDELMRINNLNSPSIRSGQELIIKL